MRYALWQMKTPLYHIIQHTHEYNNNKLIIHGVIIYKSISYYTKPN